MLNIYTCTSASERNLLSVECVCECACALLLLVFFYVSSLVIIGSQATKAFIGWITRMNTRIPILTTFGYRTERQPSNEWWWSLYVSCVCTRHTCALLALQTLHAAAYNTYEPVIHILYLQTTIRRTRKCLLNDFKILIFNGKPYQIGSF